LQPLSHGVFPQIFERFGAEKLIIGKNPRKEGFHLIQRSGEVSPGWFVHSCPHLATLKAENWQSHIFPPRMVPTASIPPEGFHGPKWFTPNPTRKKHPESINGWVA